MYLAIILVLIVIYIFRKWIYSHWTRRGIPQIGPTFPFGNFTATFLQRRSYSERATELYFEASSKLLPFVGVYVLFQPVLLITDADLAKRILTEDFEYFHDRGTHVDEKRDPLSAHLFSLAGTKWRRMRQKLSPAFSTAKIKAMFSTMMGCGRNLSVVIDRHLNKPLHIRELMTRYTMDVIASVGFGLECNSLENPDEQFRRLGMKFFSSSWKTSFRMLMAFVAPSVNRYLRVKLVDDDVEEYMMRLVRETIDRRESGSEVRRDFLQMLVQMRNQGELTDRWEMDKVDQEKSLTVEEIAAQAFVFLNAGYETTSSTIAFCLFELCRKRELHAKAVEEIDRILGGGEITYEALGRMTYLEACIDETLRKYPISPILFRVCTKPYKIPDTEIVLEKGTLVHIPLVGIHLDPRYYYDAPTFEPLRFAVQNIADFKYYAFGAGPRTCIGMRMGKVMAKMALVELLSRYRFILDYPLHDNLVDMDPSLLMLQAKPDIMVIPMRREANAQ